MKSGFIYILFNPTLRANLYKIGVTTKNPEIRARQLSAGTGIASKFEVAYKELVSDCHAVEKLIHKRLDEFRWNRDREFFELPLEEAIRRVREIVQEHQRFDEHTLFNKWRHGKENFDFSSVPAAFLERTGIIPYRVSLDPAAGTEVALLLIEEPDVLDDLSAQKPFNLFLTTGLHVTTHGPLVFHLFSIHDARQVGHSLYTVEVYQNPSDSQQTLLWRDLARQSHWHLFLLDRSRQQVDFLEFENVFNLQRTLGRIEKQCAGKQTKDFAAAKQEFCTLFTVEELLSLPTEGASTQPRLI